MSFFAATGRNTLSSLIICFNLSLATLIKKKIIQDRGSRHHFLLSSSLLTISFPSISCVISPARKIFLSQAIYTEPMVFIVPHQHCRK